MGLLDNIANTLVQDVDKLLGVTPKPLSPGQKFVQQVNAIGPIYPAAPTQLAPIAYTPPPGQQGLIFEYDLAVVDVTSRTDTFVVNVPGQKLLFRKHQSLSTLRYDINFTYQGTVTTVKNVAPGDYITVPFEKFELVPSTYILENLYDFNLGIPALERYFSYQSQRPGASFLIFQDASYQYIEPTNDIGGSSGKFVQLGGYQVNNNVGPNGTFRYIPVKGITTGIVIVRGLPTVGQICDQITLAPFFSWLWGSGELWKEMDLGQHNRLTYVSSKSQTGLVFTNAPTSTNPSDLITEIDFTGFDGMFFAQINNIGQSTCTLYEVDVFGVL